MESQSNTPKWVWLLLTAAVFGVSSAGALFQQVDDVPPLLRASWRLQLTAIGVMVCSKPGVSVIRACVKKFQIGLGASPTVDLPDNCANVPVPIDAVQTAECASPSDAVEADDAATVLVAALSTWPPCEGSTGMDGGMDGGML